jgi:glycosyltransferase involved in cell wall biosynthesis
MKVFLKIVPNEFKNESRNKRELLVVNTFEMNTVIMAKGDNNINFIDGYRVHRRTTRPLGNHKCLIKLNRIISVFTWASHARRIKPYCISCHDLIALFIGWLSTCFIPKRKKPLLVYDSHEFEIGRNTGTKRNKLTKFTISRLEKFLIKKCAFSIMVNDSIADEVQRIHKLKEKPIIVRNIPAYWDVDEEICKKRKEEFCEKLGLPMDTFLVMYHGGVMPGRGIENLLKAIQRNINVATVILGNGEKEYIEKLKHMVEELQISERVLFHCAVNIDILWQYVGAADIGMVTIPAVSKSYYYMLPNKFFENIQSLTPIIGSDFPEIRRIIKGYNIGLCVNPERIDEIANAIEEMRKNREMYSWFKRNLKYAKDELCWENERNVLEEAYGKILR